MGLGVAGGRLASATLVAACFVSACGGQSFEVPSDDGSAGEGNSAGSGGTSGSAQGGSDVGGSAPAGGTIGVGGGVSTGGTTGGFAGSIPTGGFAGTVGVGGADPCPECPPAAYGLTVHGDGPSYELAYNGYLLADSDQVYCAEQPLRGTFGGCGGVGVSACEHPMSVPPCLSVRGTSAVYVDGRTGEWTGSVTGIVLSNPAPMVASGTFGLELGNADGGFLALTVDYTVCEFGLRGVASICR